VTAYFIEWLSLLGRWLHLIAGIAWIGSSFYFVWLNNHVIKPDDDSLLARGVGGEAWLVHGGAFYSAQKYSVAPTTLPHTLHWFYWEAYTTFLSGFFLLCLMYYGQAEIYLIDPRVMPLSKPAGIALALSFIIFGWLIYDAICRSPLGRNARATGVAVLLLVISSAWGLCHLFSGRGAFIEFGAMLGSIMVANVFFVIIRGQRKLVRALQEGREPDPEDGRRGSLRSTHNTYFTLPVLFTMTSNHYAITYGARYNWLVLIALSIAGVLIRVYFIARHATDAHGKPASALAVWPAALAALILAALIAALKPATSMTASASANAANIEFAQIRKIVTQRCVPCHAETPSQPGFVAAPKGVMLDTPEQILLHLAVMQQQLVTGTMPVANLTGMKDEERAHVLDWIQRGAPH
jgi:uncharacterized membrane protein